MSDMTNGKLFKLVTVENIVGLLIGVFAVGGSYALTSYKTDEAKMDIEQLRIEVKNEGDHIYQIKSDIRNIKTHLDYQKQDLQDIKEILKAQ